MSSLRTREAFAKEEFERLAPYALKSAESRGRLVPEPEHPYRTAFQRDRDRIVHSTAFRRLEYKTQVFVHHEGDHYRNRLTHTIEAAQIVRSIARALRANEDIAEAITLAHDLGHTPFGHAGERVLDQLMQGEGGFDHNRQTVRIVDWLEERYPAFRGLNLTSETREGLLKHGAGWEHPVPLPELGQQPSLEAQIADLSDEIAYTNHDLDDGLRSGLLRLEQLDVVPLWATARAAAQERAPDGKERVVRAQTIVILINQLVTDLVETSTQRLGVADYSSPDAVRYASDRVAGFSVELAVAFAKLKAFLSVELYDHPAVVEKSQAAEQILGDLFRAYRKDSGRLPGAVVKRFDDEGEARAIADYIAGMTDRFAMDEHARLRGEA